MSWQQRDRYIESVKEDFDEAYEDGNLVRCMILVDELRNHGFDEQASKLLADKSEKSLLKQISRGYAGTESEPPEENL